MNGSLSNVPNLGGVLLRWAKWADEEEPRAFAETLLESDRGTFRLVQGFVGIGHRYATGDRAARREFRIDLDGLAKVSGEPLAQMANRCRSLLDSTPEWLDEDGRRVLGAFIDEVTNPRDVFGFPKGKDHPS